jgi:hypothetical protein
MSLADISQPYMTLSSPKKINAVFRPTKASSHSHMVVHDQPPSLSPFPWPEWAQLPSFGYHHRCPWFISEKVQEV